MHLMEFRADQTGADACTGHRGLRSTGSCRFRIPLDGIWLNATPWPGVRRADFSGRGSSHMKCPKHLRQEGFAYSTGEAWPALSYGWTGGRREQIELAGIADSLS